MQTVNFVERFIIYIEDHIRENIDYDEVLLDMSVEPKSFITIFSSLVGFSPYEYQMRRKMTEIAYELEAGHRRLIDISKQYGFHDIEQFKKTYREAFGISPYETEKYFHTLDLTERISFEVVPVERPKYRSTEMHIEGFRIIGAVRRFSVDHYSTLMKYDFLSYLEDNHVLEELLKYNDGHIKGIVLLERYIGGKMELMIGVSSYSPAPFEETYTESGDYVIFESEGNPEVVSEDIYRYIFRRWRFKEERELNCAYSMELIKSRSLFFSEDSKVQVWQRLSD